MTKRTTTSPLPNDGLARDTRQDAPPTGATARLLPIARTSTTSTPATFVAACTHANHPTLAGRVRASWTAAGIEHERWLAALRGLAIRMGDRLLVSQPSNWDEPIVTGVIDGFARRPRPSREHAATLDLLPDEAVCIRSADGVPLVELTSGPHGADITLLRPDARFMVDGELAIEAKTITLTAREGEARIQASDDVVVAGENIQLN